MGQLICYHAGMRTPPHIPHLLDLVATVVSTDDPTLLRRSCAALDMILADYSERPML